MSIQSITLYVTTILTLKRMGLTSCGSVVTYEVMEPGSYNIDTISVEKVDIMDLWQLTHLNCGVR